MKKQSSLKGSFMASLQKALLECLFYIMCHEIILMTINREIKYNSLLQTIEPLFRGITMDLHSKVVMNS